MRKIFLFFITIVFFNVVYCQYNDNRLHKLELLEGLTINNSYSDSLGNIYLLFTTNSPLFWNNTLVTSGQKVIGKLDRYFNRKWIKAVNINDNIKYTNNKLILYTERSNYFFDPNGKKDELAILSVDSGIIYKKYSIPNGIKVNDVAYLNENRIRLFGHISQYYLGWPIQQYINTINFGNGFSYNLNHYYEIFYYADLDSNFNTKKVFINNTINPNTSQLNIKQCTTDIFGNSYSLISANRFEINGVTILNNQIGILKIDKNANIVWCKVLNINTSYFLSYHFSLFYCTSLQQLFFIAGAFDNMTIDTFNIYSSNGRFLISSLDTSGKVLFAKNYGLNYPNLTNSCIDNYGNILLCGNVTNSIVLTPYIKLENKSVYTTNQQPFYLKFNSNGDFHFGESVDSGPCANSNSITILPANDYSFYFIGFGCNELQIANNEYLFSGYKSYLVNIGCELPSLKLNTDKLYICENEQTILKSNIGNTSFPYKLNWIKNNIIIDSNVSYKNLKVNSSGKYSVILKQDEVCIDTSNTIEITVKPNPKPVIVGSNNKTSFCKGESLKLAVVTDNDPTYRSYDSIYWNNGSFKSNITVSDSGTFKVKAKANGCYGESEVFNVKTDTIPSRPSILKENCILRAIPYNRNTYQSVYWYRDGLRMPTYDGETEISAFSDKKSDYEIKLIDGNGCVSPISYKTIAICDFIASSKTNKQTKVILFPNPTNNILNIAGLKCSTNYIISESSGIMILQGQTDNKIDISTLKSGLYFCKINDMIYKFIKE